MAKINQSLLERLATKLGVTKARIYSIIRQISHKNRVPRHLGALLLAGDNNISVQKYATAQDLADLRGIPHHIPVAVPAAADLSPRAVVRKGKAAKLPKTKGNSVFVVHGRDEVLRKSMFEFLRALGLNPMEWSHAVETAKGANPYVGDILDAAMAKVQAVVVLFSPDEIAHLKEQFWGADDKQGDGKPAGQARPNVLFEAGLALGAYPKKTVIVQVGKVRPFSDIAGKHLVKLTNDIARRNELANRLAKIGCDVNKVGNDWMTTGTFEPTEPKPKKTKKPGKRH